MIGAVRRTASPTAQTAMAIISVRRVQRICQLLVRRFFRVWSLGDVVYNLAPERLRLPAGRAPTMAVPAQGAATGRMLKATSSSKAGEVI